MVKNVEIRHTNNSTNREKVKRFFYLYLFNFNANSKKANTLLNKSVAK